MIREYQPKSGQILDLKRQVVDEYGHNVHICPPGSPDFGSVGAAIGPSDERNKANCSGGFAPILLTAPTGHFDDRHSNELHDIQVMRAKAQGNEFSRPQTRTSTQNSKDSFYANRSE